MNTENQEPNEFPLTDATDMAILMHRDAHFGGQFEIMLEYYIKGGKGVNPEFDVERIQELAVYEKQTKQNLATILLSGADAERIARAKEAYKTLRDLYDTDKPFTKNPRLIADLILTESEDPQEEIAAIAKEKVTIVPALIELIRSEDYHDPLFPGFGMAPMLAIRAMGVIGDKKAIITLFEAIGTGDFFDDDLILEALHAIGEPAKIFLLKVLHGKPLNEDNERAAIALIAFKEDPEVAKACLNLLKDPETFKDLPFATYLVLACEWLKDENLRKEFAALATDSRTPKDLQLDIKAIAKLHQS